MAEAIWNWVGSSEHPVKCEIGGYTFQLGNPQTIFLVLGHAFSSSTLSIVNKYALTVFGYPSVLTAIQYAASALAVWVLGHLSVLDHDDLDWNMLWKYFPAAVTFYVAIWTNANLLNSANVDTFIVFRSTTPILVALSDSFFRGVPWPSYSTWGSMSLIVLGAVGYVLSESELSVTTYFWAVTYLVTITFEMVYVKHIVHSLGLNSWGFVYYNNVLSLALSPIFWLLTGEHKIIFQRRPVGSHPPSEVMFPVLLSCVLGLSLSFFSFATRKAISATSFTVLGCVSKLATILINTLMWSRHASPTGLFCLLITVAGGILYQQTLDSARAEKGRPSTGEKSGDGDRKVGAEIEAGALGDDRNDDDDEKARLLSATKG